MGKKSRTKGKTGEREVLNLLGDRLGQRYARNLNQSDLGGCDCIELDGVALEIKRAAKPLINKWWEQTCEQANKMQRRPVLAYRLDRQQWTFVVLLNDVADGVVMGAHRVALDIDGFVELYKYWRAIAPRID